MDRCPYRVENECALLSKDFDLSECEDRLMHAIGCRDEIIELQSQIIYEQFAIIGQKAMMSVDEMERIVDKINEAAIKRAEI